MSGKKKCGVGDSGPAYVSVWLGEGRRTQIDLRPAKVI